MPDPQPDFSMFQPQADFSMFAGPPPPKPKPTYAEAKTPAERKAALADTPSVQSLTNVVGGLGREVERRAVTLAKPIRKAFGMQPAPPVPAETTTGGKVGQLAEQTLEFAGGAGLIGKVSKLMGLAPTARAAGLVPLITRYGKAAVEAAMQAVGAGSIAKVQGDPHPGRAAAIAGAVPVLGQVALDAAPAIRASAERGVARVLRSGQAAKRLDATEMPRIIAQAASDAIDIGLQKTWKAAKTVTHEARVDAGQTLDEIIKGPAGREVLPTQSVRDELDRLITRMSKRVEFLDEDNKPLRGLARKKALQAFAQGGHMTSDVTVVTERQMNHPLMRAVQQIKQQLPDYLYARDLVTLKRMWDAAVFGKNEAGEPVVYLGDRLVSVTRLAAKNAADGIRDLFTDVSKTPNPAGIIAKANDIAARSIKLDQLMRSAARAAAPAGRPTSHQVANMAARAAVGGIFGEEFGRRQYNGMAGGVVGAVLGLGGVRLLETAMSSAAWKFFPAAQKAALAQAIVDGRADQAMRILAPLVTKAGAGTGSPQPAAPPPAGATPGAAGAAATPPSPAAPAQGQQGRATPPGAANQPPLASLQRPLNWTVDTIRGMIGVGADSRAKRFGELLVGAASLPLPMRWSYFARAAKAGLTDLQKFGVPLDEVVTSVSPTLVGLRSATTGNILPRVNINEDPVGYISTLRKAANIANPMAEPGSTQSTGLELVIDDLAHHFSAKQYDPFLGNQTGAAAGLERDAEWRAGRKKLEGEMDEFRRQNAESGFYPKSKGLDANMKDFRQNLDRLGQEHDERLDTGWDEDDEPPPRKP